MMFPVYLQSFPSVDAYGFNYLVEVFLLFGDFLSEVV